MEGIVNSLGFLSAAIIDKIGTDLPNNDKSIWEVYGFVLAYLKECDIIDNFIASSLMTAISREYLWPRRNKCLKWLMASYAFYIKQISQGLVKMKIAVPFNLKHPSMKRKFFDDMQEDEMDVIQLYRDWMAIEGLCKTFGIDAAVTQ